MKIPQLYTAIYTEAFSKAKALIIPKRIIKPVQLKTAFQIQTIQTQYQ